MVTAALLCAISGCSDSQLYRGSDVAFQNDRLALSGRFCTVDPAQQRFPVKVLFLIDRSSTVAGLDPDYNYSRAVDDVVQRYINSPRGNYYFGIIGYGGHAQLLSAGAQGEVFTRNAALLQNAVQLLRLPDPCASNHCRDLPAAISLAASLISGDLLSSTRGDVQRTRYVVVNFAAGPPSPRITKCQCGDVARDPMCMNPPMISDQVCEQQIYLKQLTDLVTLVQKQGAPDLRYHTFYLRDPKLMPLSLHDETIALLQKLSQSGNGAFDCRTAGNLPDCSKSPEADSCRRQGMLCPSGVASFLDFALDSTQRPFLIKKLLVTNLNAVADASGPQLDSDGDGLSDQQEMLLHTRPDLADTDGDGISDLVEVRLALDPLKPDPQPGVCHAIDFSQLPGTPLPDTDGDFLNDCEELLLGTDPNLADTDGDGMPDGMELRAGTNYLQADYLLPPYDHDGIPNGDEVRQHTAPREDDTADALGHAYAYEEVDEGVKSLPFASQPRDVTGVSVLDVSPGSTAGGGTLRYLAGPPSAALQWKDPGDCDFGDAVLIDAAEIQRLGGKSYSLPSRSVNHQCTVVGQPMPPLMSDFRLTVRIDNAAVLRKTAVDETIVIGTAMRACETYKVRNIGLLTPLPDQTPGRQTNKNGINNIYVFFGQGPDGQLVAPGIFSSALVRVRYAPPLRREPGDPEILLQQEDFVVLGGN